MHDSNPTVFISYAGEDKPFVVGLVTKLRRQGVNAWCALWEILPGDSLVEKIFDEGLRNARSAVIVVVSPQSIDKPWVREELNIAVVKRITERVKLIPVVLGDAQVPYSLTATRWVRIHDLDNYQAQFDEIVMSIFGYYDRPPLGKSPPYAGAGAEAVPGLTGLDSLVLKLAGDRAVEAGQLVLGTTSLLTDAQHLGVAKGRFYEALDALECAGHLRVERVESLEDPIFLIEFTVQGFEQYARSFSPHHDELVRIVISQLVNLGVRDSRAIANAIGQPPLLVEHVFDLLAEKQFVQVSKYEGGAMVFDVSSQLKRLLQ